MMVSRLCRKRAGVASMWVLVALAFVSVMSMAAVGQFGAVRRQLDLHQNRAQAEWLARSGIELACDRLAAHPEDYQGETLKPIPRSEVRIVVRKESASTFRVEAQARFPTETRGTETRTATRVFKHVNASGGARLEMVPDDAEKPKSDTKQP